MSNIYLASNKVELYPSAFRGKGSESGSDFYNPESHLTTEFNISMLINRLTYKDSFVFDYQHDNSSTHIYFNLHGYYFKADIHNLINSQSFNWNQIWVRTKIVPLNPNPDAFSYYAYTLVGDSDYDDVDNVILDNDSNQFVGIKLEDAEPTLSTNEYSLLLLEKINGVWTVPTESKLKFDLDSIKGGEIENVVKSLYQYFENESIKTDSLEADSATIENLRIGDGNTNIGASDTPIYYDKTDGFKTTGLKFTITSTQLPN